LKAGPRTARGEVRAASALLLSVLLASCSATGSPELASPSFTGPPEGEVVQSAETGTSTEAYAGGEAGLPDEVASLPMLKSGTDAQAAATAEPAAPAASAAAEPQAPAAQPGAAEGPVLENGGAALTAGVMPKASVAEPRKRGFLSAFFGTSPAAAATSPIQEKPEPQSGLAAAEPDYPAAQPQTPAPEPQAPAAQPAAAEDPAPENGGAVLTAGVMPESPLVEPKKRGFLSAFFGTSPAAGASSAIKKKPQAATAMAEPAGKPPAKPERPVRLASLDDGQSGEFALPGVRKTALFEIKRRSGLDDDSDIDLHEEELYSAPVRVASAAGLARLAPNGLLKQTDDVDVACLKPSLVRVLKQVERRYGKKLIVTSGYRDRARNIRARGAKNSLHMYCAAADIQVPGVGKKELASFLRAMPGRGGVGTYCHTNSVHVDIGPERDWNWRCRRRG
jgi:uncharacterized protein YcbK (DUF882 family)